jgi:hypothetical protein
VSSPRSIAVCAEGVDTSARIVLTVLSFGSCFVVDRLAQSVSCDLTELLVVHGRVRPYRLACGEFNTPGPVESTVRPSAFAPVSLPQARRSVLGADLNRSEIGAGCECTARASARGRLQRRGLCQHAHPLNQWHRSLD